MTTTITPGLRQIIKWARSYIDNETCINEVPNDRLDPEERAGLAELKRLESTMTQPIPRVELVEVEELTDTPRGQGGFGSTGQ